MADEPTNSELRQLITEVRADLNAGLNQLVRRDVYDARESARDAAMTDLRKDVDKIEADREKEAERRASDRRLMFTSLIAPVALLALVLWLASKGFHS